MITISCGENTMQNIHADESKLLLKKLKSKSKDIEFTVLNSDCCDNHNGSKRYSILNEDISETELAGITPEQKTNTNLKYYNQVVQNNYAVKGHKNNNASLKTFGEVQPIITISCDENTMHNIHDVGSKQFLKKPKSKSRDIELTVLNSVDSDEKDTISQKMLILNEDVYETDSFVSNDWNIRMEHDELRTNISGITGDTSPTDCQRKFGETGPLRLHQRDGSEEDFPADWFTTIAEDAKINKIEKVNQASNSWNTHPHKAQKVEGQRDTVLNSIDKNGSGEWKFKLPNKFKTVFPNEWKSRLNTMSACSKDKWDFKYAKVDVNINDRVSNWTSTLHKIEDLKKSKESWTTTLN